MITFKKLFAMLTRKQRRTASVLLGLMFVGTIAETASIGLIIPVTALMFDPDAANRPWIQALLVSLGRPTQAQLVVGGMLALFCLYLSKAIFLAFLAWRQNKFVFGVRAVISQRLFQGYLRQPWSFHLQRNSGQLINILATETNQFTGGALLPALQLIAELMVLVGISALLVLVEPTGAFVLFAVIGLAIWCFQQMTRGPLLSWGQARLDHECNRIQHLQQGFGGAKEIKLLGREAEFLDQYRVHNFGSARVVEYLNTLQQVPRLLIEVLAMGCLAILVLIMVWQDRTPAAVLQTLGLFAVAAFRLMPSVNRIINTSQSLRNARPVIDTLQREFSLLQDDAPIEGCAPLNFEQFIKLENVAYKYDDAKASALSDISLSIPRGASIGFIGASGAGKSTIVDVILGLLTPTVGKVSVDGVDIRTNLREWQKRIGYVPQSIFLTDESLRRNVAFGLPQDQIDDAAVRRAIRAAQLETFVSSLPDGLETLVGERGVRLSGGQRQRIGIARALYHDPQVLVLDEATSALDNATEEAVMVGVNALIGQKTLVIVAHRLSTVARCDVLYALEQGRIVERKGFRNITRDAAETVGQP
jgi:ABC-type multidrug transport system fused ATPase/permease subunit